jgi:hypothetical protein
MRRPAVLLLFAAAVMGHGCRNFEGPPPPLLGVSPPRLDFSGVAGGIGPPPQALTVDAIGSGQLTWAARADVPWLSVFPACDSAPAAVWVGALIAGLPAGTYGGNVTIGTTSGPSQQVTVPVTVTLARAVSLSGRWAGATPTVTLSFVILQADTIVTGTGTLNPPLANVSVAGTFHNPFVALTLKAPDSSVTTFNGSLVNDDAIQGVLNGVGLSGVSIAVFRQ